MRISIGFLAAASLASSLAAQTTVQGYELLPGRIDAANSGVALVVRLTAPVFEALIMYNKDYVQGLGDMTGPRRKNTTGSACEFDTVKISGQDQDASTPQALKLVARPEGSPGQSDPTKTLFTQNFPARPAGTGVAGFTATVQVMNNGAFQTPCTSTWFFGVEFPALPTGTSWPNDGMSFPFASYEPWVGATPTVSDWPKGGWNADPLYDFVIGSTRGRLGGTNNNRLIMAFSLVPDTSVLQAGARHKSSTSPHGQDNGFGAAGIWPEIDKTTSRGQQSADGLVIRLTDSKATGAGAWGLFISLATASSQSLPIFRIGGLTGGLYLGIPSLFVTTGVTSGIDTEVVLAPDGTLPASLLKNTVYLQAYTSIGGTHTITNAVGIQFK